MASITELESATFSQIDSDRFGVRVARAQVVPHNLPRVLEFCTAENIDLLIARCSTNDLAAAQEMQMHGFLMMDTLVYYGFDLRRRPIPEDNGKLLVRTLRPEDRDQVRNVAKEAFKGYMGHYHADRRLDRRKCDETYASWAERSCVPKAAADAVLVAEHNGDVAGFATLRLNSSEEVEGILFAVAPEWQGHGVCGSLMIHSLRWTAAQGAQRMIISTQVTNVSMQKVWCRVGFEPSHSYYTFHKWFDR
jgi:GNAT superfamily N-acetyltransferase